MQVIPVIDLRLGQAVHAKAGNRDQYRAVRGPLASDGDPLALAAFFSERSPAAIYLADLDAILGGAAQRDLWLEISKRAACPLWIDFGVRDDRDLEAFLEFNALSKQPNFVVLGSETLQNPLQIRRMARLVPPKQMVLSLDRRNGKPLSNRDSSDETLLLTEAQEAGISQVIALDLAAVGEGRAVDLLESWHSLMSQFHHFQWILGGGVGGQQDLLLASIQGFRAVLSATAILEGKL